MVFRADTFNGAPLDTLKIVQNCGFATMKLSGNNPLDASVAPEMVWPAGMVTPMLVVLRVFATARKSPLAKLVWKAELRRSASDPVIFCPTTRGEYRRIRSATTQLGFPNQFG